MTPEGRRPWRKGVQTRHGLVAACISAGEGRGKSKGRVRRDTWRVKTGAVARRKRGHRATARRVEMTLKDAATMPEATETREERRSEMAADDGSDAGVGREPRGGRQIETTVQVAGST